MLISLSDGCMEVSQCVVDGCNLLQQLLECNDYSATIHLSASKEMMEIVAHIYTFPIKQLPAELETHTARRYADRPLVEYMGGLSYMQLIDLRNIARYLCSDFVQDIVALELASRIIENPNIDRTPIY